MNTQILHALTLDAEDASLRLDQALAKKLSLSRTQIQLWIKNGEVSINGKVVIKMGTYVYGGEHIDITGSIKIPPVAVAQNIPLHILYEDEELLVVNKPVGLVVHPGAGNPEKTLLNALLYYLPAQSTLPRAGIVHRLDKETSGLLVVAKTPTTLAYLINELKTRKVKRIYQAIVNGVLIAGGKIDKPIGRHAIHRKKMTVTASGKEAITHYKVIERYRGHTRLKVELETGRTHQIRVHMAHNKHAIIGDPIYGGRLQLPKGATPPLVQLLRQFKRQALHATELSLVHPTTGKTMSWRAPLPDDMTNLIDTLQADINSLHTYYDDDYE
jgi:23S rRNA pseudouridine1911/1915/1917 synthase